MYRSSMVSVGYIQGTMGLQGPLLASLLTGEGGEGRRALMGLTWTSWPRQCVPASLKGLLALSWPRCAGKEEERGEEGTSLGFVMALRRRGEGGISLGLVMLRKRRREGGGPL